MKTIVLIPVKNEQWIIENTLSNITPNVDLVIIADQKSTDRTVEICQKFSKVKIINNPYLGHSNQVRWLLLEEARKIPGDNLIICLDADEIISPRGIEEMKEKVQTGIATKGDVFKFQWIQLYPNIKKYRNDGVWKDSFKNIAFLDNQGINEYSKSFVINDHTSRVPNTKIKNEILIPHPLLHFHFLAGDRTQLKQAWYRCCELIKGDRNAKRINNTYRVTLLPDNIKTFEVSPEWCTGLVLPSGIENILDDWHLKEIIGFFDKYGIKFFEPLQIWHVPELHNEFVKIVKREPVSKTYPAWLVYLNEIKNKIRCHF